jgi:hypothetical protein
MRVLNFSPRPDLFVDTNVLGGFPLVVKKAIVSSTVGFLIDASTKSILLTKNHVLWSMEIIGQGFALPMEVQLYIL